MPLALLSNWRVILGALMAIAIIGLGWALKHQVAENGRLEQGLSIATESANRNAKAVVDLTNAHKIDMASVTALYERERARNARLNILIDEVMHAPDSDDAPLAPVLSGLPDRLRRDADGQGGGNSQGNGPGAPVNMR